jgi:hypothetical protein
MKEILELAFAIDLAKSAAYCQRMLQEWEKLALRIQNVGYADSCMAQWRLSHFIFWYEPT